MPISRSSSITRRLLLAPLAGTALHAPGHAPSLDDSRHGAPQQSAARRHTLMPVPASISWGEGAFRLDSTIAVGLTRFADDRLRRGANRAIARLESRTGLNFPAAAGTPDASPPIRIEVETAGQRVQSLEEDESYALVITSSAVSLRAPTVVGALRGLETLIQLVDSDRDGFFLPAVRIDDAPRFRWRGVLLDVSRHFMPVERVKRTLDGMAAVKLNVFHWHLTDDQGFRVESKRYPKLHTLGADGQYYTQTEIRDVVAYARDRGIRVLPEFDMPGHTASWLIGYPQFASTTAPREVQRRFGPSDAIMDPSREALYTFIDGFIAEMAPLFPDRYWHVGGDEVDARQWDTRRIREFRRTHRLRDAAALQAYFNQRLTRILRKHNKRLVGWDEVIHPNLPTNSVVQSWRSVDQLARATNAGYLSILSAPYYLDYILSAEEHYNADPVPQWTALTQQQQALVIGGEACMWAEHVTAETVESRLWPRLAAVAERFWSPRDVIQVYDMYRRLGVMNERLEQLGLGQRTHIERMVRRIAPDSATRQAMTALLEAVGPPSFGQRVRGQRTTQLTPLVRALDAAVPDPVGRWRTSMLVDRLLSDTAVARVDASISVADARAELTALFTRWRDAGDGIRKGAELTPLVGEAVPAAAALQRTAQAGLEALGFLAGGAQPPAGWSDAVLTELRQYEQPQNLLRVMIVQPVRRLVGAAALISNSTGQPPLAQTGYFVKTHEAGS
jgi:hexosaminidase